MNTPEYPTPSQRKTIWTALTALCTVLIGAIAVGLIWLTSEVFAFLQPILIPFAIAGVIAYLLDPVVSRMVKWGTSRHRAVLGVFSVFSLALLGALMWIIPALWSQVAHLKDKTPAYHAKIVKSVDHFNVWAHDLEKKFGVRVFPQIPDKIENPLPPATTPKRDGIEGPSATDGTSDDTPSAAVEKTPTDPSEPAPVQGAKPATNATADSNDTLFDIKTMLSPDWVRTAGLAVLRKTWDFATNSIGGFLGIFGFLLSMIIVPIYLYYFLIESKTISETWGDYVPLRASAFKDEVVSALGEINGYLIAFFRGQLIVSLINGTATGLGLIFVGLDFGLLIGLTLCFLGLIPYLGITLCWIPAVIIAAIQGGSWLVSDSASWWVFPAIVSGIFFGVQQIDGFFVTPKIVGESVGLHPVTVIVSVFGWSLLMGGLLGAILAVPMTATVKVLLRRYVWERRFKADVPLATEEHFSENLARAGTTEAATALHE